MYIKILTRTQPVYDLSFQWVRNAPWRVICTTSLQVKTGENVTVNFSGIDAQGYVLTCTEKRVGLWNVCIVGGAKGLTSPLVDKRQFNASVQSAVLQLAKKAEVTVAPESIWPRSVLQWLVPKDMSLLQVLSRTIPLWHMKLDGSICIGDVWPDSTSVNCVVPQNMAITQQFQYTTVYRAEKSGFLPLTTTRRGVTFTAIGGIIEWSEVI